MAGGAVGRGWRDLICLCRYHQPNVTPRSIVNDGWPTDAKRRARPADRKFQPPAISGKQTLRTEEIDCARAAAAATLLPTGIAQVGMFWEAGDERSITHIDT